MPSVTRKPGARQATFSAGAPGPEGGAIQTPEPSRAETSTLLHEATRGDEAAAARLAPLVYDNLRRLAADQVGRGADWTCQPTAIVHEAFLRLVDQTRVDWQGRTHFMAIGAEMVRRVIVDEARRRSSQKRGGGWGRLTLDGASLERQTRPIDPLELDEALTRFAAIDARAARVVELRFFSGLTETEIGEVLGVSVRTVRNDWRAARAWLRWELADEDDGEI